MAKNSRKKSAFSLFELSIIFLAIGLMIGLVTGSSHLIREFRIAAARKYSRISPVQSTDNLVIWYDATNEESYLAGEFEDHDYDATAAGVSYLADLSQNSSIRRNATQSVSGSRPFYYKSCINDLPCLRFDGSSDYLSFDAEPLIGKDYTIFVVEQRRSSSESYFIGTSASASENQSLRLGYSDSDEITFGQGSNSTSNTLDIASYSAPKAKLHTFVNAYLTSSASPPNFYYINNSQTAETFDSSTTLESMTSYANPSIGAHYKSSLLYYSGDIGEIIIFNRALKNQERREIQEYLMKKWRILQ